jgi:hypothetical protein
MGLIVEISILTRSLLMRLNANECKLMHMNAQVCEMRDLFILPAYRIFVDKNKILKCPSVTGKKNFDHY